jgi:hypothetical protein
VLPHAAARSARSTGVACIDLLMACLSKISHSTSAA